MYQSRFISDVLRAVDGAWFLWGLIMVPLGIIFFASAVPWFALMVLAMFSWHQFNMARFDSAMHDRFDKPLPKELLSPNYPEFVDPEYDDSTVLKSSATAHRVKGWLIIIGTVIGFGALGYAHIHPIGTDRGSIKEGALCRDYSRSIPFTYPAILQKVVKYDPADCEWEKPKLTY